MQQSKYKIFPMEYDLPVVNPLNNTLYSAVTGNPIPGAPTLFNGDPRWVGSGCLHHWAGIDANNVVWVMGENTCNISGLGATPNASIGMTKTNVNNAKQVVAYANSGDPGGLGYGVMVLTNDGKLILLGNSQSGFRNDGTEGNEAEPGPFVIPNLYQPVVQIAVGSACYALLADGTVISWGGTRRQYYPTYVLGRGVDNPDATRAGQVVLPEPITDIQGGGEMTYFIGKSGVIYGVAYDTRYLGLAPVNGANVPGQNTPFNLTKTLALPAVPMQIAVGPQATYALMPNGDSYSWGDNTQAAIGNGHEAQFSNGTAPWTGSWTLPQYTPVKTNPTGVSFVRIFASIGDAFYVYYEDMNANLWNNGRNKGFVLWNGQGGTSQQQAATPNAWDVLTVTKIAGFGTIITPPVTTPRTVTKVSINMFGVWLPVPITDAKFIFSDGGTQ